MTDTAQLEQRSQVDQGRALKNWIQWQKHPKHNCVQEWKLRNGIEDMPKEAPETPKVEEGANWVNQ